MYICVLWLVSIMNLRRSRIISGDKPLGMPVREFPERCSLRWEDILWKWATLCVWSSCVKRKMLADHRHPSLYVLRVDCRCNVMSCLTPEIIYSPPWWDPWNMSQNSSVLLALPLSDTLLQYLKKQLNATTACKSIKNVMGSLPYPLIGLFGLFLIFFWKYCNMI